MGKIKSESPTIIAVNHWPNNTIPGFCELKLFLEKKASDSKKRTLFIEGDRLSTEWLQQTDQSLMQHEPFREAILIAQKAGWDIKPLDSSYGNEDRENNWARIVKKYAKPEDIVIMHPNHVRGFLISSRIKEKMFFGQTNQKNLFLKAKAD